MNSRRFESIGGILNRTSRTAASLEAGNQTQPQPAPVGASRTADGDTRTRTSTPLSADRQARPKASAQSDGGVRRIAFRLEPGLHEALTARAAADKISQGQVVLNCIDTAHKDHVLDEVVAAERDAPQTDSLFPRLRSRNAAQPSVPVEIRLHAQAATVLEQLVHQTTADSRTQLITAVLRHSLT